MRRTIPKAAGPCVIAAWALAACAAPSAPDAQRVGLTASSYNAGAIGHAQLIGRDQQTDVVLTVSGMSSWIARPVHLYAYVHEGSCEQPSTRPQYALTDRVLTRRGADGFLTLTSTLPVSLAALRGGPHALLVRSSPADANLPLFCGDLQPA